MINYDKKSMSVSEQIGLLKSRGLIIDNLEFATKFLENINYYHFSGYLYVFENKLSTNDRSHIFENTSFGDVYKFYNTDIKIIQLLFSCISYFEIYMRNIMARKGLDVYNNDPFFNYSLDCYSSINKYLIKEANKSKEIFILHYKNKYNNNLDYIPIWINVEIMSLGNLYKFYNYSENKLKSQISNSMNIYHHSFIKSWLYTMTFIRNKAAHHSRVLYLSLSSCKMKIPMQNNIILNSNYSWNDLENDSLFNFIVTLEYMAKVSNIHITSTLYFINQIYKQLFKLKSTVSFKDKKHILDKIGIPDNWNGDNFFIK